MANFFEGLWNIAKHPVDEAKFLWDEGVEDVGKNLVRGNFGEAWDELKGIPGAHNRMMSENIAVPLGGRNKITENPDAAAGAVIGSIFAAPVIGGMMGGSGAGASASGASAGGSSFGGFGTEGAFSNYFKPTGISKPGLSAEGVGWQGGAKLDLGVPETYSGMKDVAGSGSNGFSMEKLAQVMKSIKPHDDTPPINMTRTGGGGGRYDKSVFENPLLTREYNALYSQPLYNKLT